MRNTLDISLKNLKWIRIRKKRMSATLLLLSLVVTLNVFWFLRQPGLTLAGDASCGIQEHTHNDSCGTKMCVCNPPEEPHIHDESCYQVNWIEAYEKFLLVCESTEDPHIHTDDCYETMVLQGTETNLICENQDHSHEDACYQVIITDSREEKVLACELVLEPHQHTESCYITEVVEAQEERVLICSLLEEAHTHNDGCYEYDFICELEEHVHSIDCYSDKNADVETMLDWQEMFANYPYTGNLRADLVGIAKTQVGYSESALNFEVGSDGIRRGYTRYGAWYGTPYRDWSAMFVSFCLNYAGADSEENPGNTGASSMAELWNKLGKYAPADTYTPISGDLVFFDNNTVGIVAEIHHTTLHVIRGDVNQAVCEELLVLTDASIIGWGITEGRVPASEQDLNTEEQQPSLEVGNEDILDVSHGPAFFIFESGESMPQMQGYSLRSSRTITDLLPYLEANGGSYFFTLLDFNNIELPKDEEGNYLAQANTGYKLTLTFTSPEGFLPGTYQYQIPNGLMVDGGEGTFILKDGTNVGTWVVTDTGLITLVFNEHMNSRTDITISATLGIHFPEQEDPIDFDGFITVKVEPPPEQKAPTELSKWGAPNAEAGKLNWFVKITGHADSQIPGSIITDQATLPDWGKPHSYTESDIAAGITISATAADGSWHSWTVTTDDPHLIWDESSWSYKIPQTVNCDYCGELELGNDGWEYLVTYTSTPTPLNTPGAFAYENKVTIDGQTAWGWNEFNHGEVAAQVIKNGSFVSDAAGGGFLWEVQVTIPGRPEGQRAEYSWFIMDEMKLFDESGKTIQKVHNDMNLATVTATYNGTVIEIPRIQDATDQDMFAWDAAWASDGVASTRTINFLCRCQCTTETCHWGSCENYWFKYDDGTAGTKGFCQCWTENQNMTFTFVYKTEDLSIIQDYGTLGYQLNNQAQLYYMIDTDNGSITSVQADYDDATVTIPNLFEKQLTHDFDGYTANYKVTINEGKLTLTNGSPLYIHDMMTKTLAYISGSLVITAEDANGNITTLKHGTDYTVTYDGSGKQTDDQGNEVHVLDIVILHPQPVMYVLDYDTTLIIPEHVTGAVKYSNSAEITLWGEDIKDSAVEKVYADINIAAKSYKVEIIKTAAKTGEALAGATFGLYNEHGGLIATEITDFHGELLFQTNITQGIILREHILYYMQELKPPPGYKLDATKYWFCFCDQMGDSCEICDEVMEGLNAVRIPYEQVGKVQVTNELLKYALPATGGSGIYPVILVSVILILTPLVYMSIRRRKRERRGVG